jgi:hypothetical protein
MAGRRTSLLQVPTRDTMLDANGNVTRQWQEFFATLGGAELFLDTHAIRTGTKMAASDLPVGTQFYETDRGLFYVVRLNTSSDRVWQYVSGQMRGTVIGTDQKPTDLGTFDAGLIFYATDAGQFWQWNGSSWKWLLGQMSGATASRPATLAASSAGFRFYDTTQLIASIWSGSAWANEQLEQLDSLGTVRATGNTYFNLTGSGVEIAFQAAQGFILAYDRTGGAYLPLELDGFPLRLNPGSGKPVCVNASSDDSSGCKLQVTGNISNGGNKVIGSRGAAVGTVAGSANATYGSNEQTIINALITKLNAIDARLNSTTGHGLWT